MKVPPRHLRPLACHPATPARGLRSIRAGLERTPGELKATYVWCGDLAAVCFPAPRAAGFADGLWRASCCELFVAAEGGTAYREFNFSPSGEWAAYAFERYREAGARLPCAPRIDVSRRGDEWRLEATVEGLDGRLRAGLAAVVQAADGSLSYWSLAHPAGAPDFHHPVAFALELA